MIEYVERGPDQHLAKRVELLRLRGHRGGFIPRHRALLSSPRDGTKLVTSFLLTVVFWLAFFLGRNAIAGLWHEVLEFWRVALGLSGYTTNVGYELWGLRFTVPYLHFPAGVPDNLTWWIGAVFVAILLVTSLVLPHRYLPLSYFLRIVAFFQTTAQVYFDFWLERFPYSAAGYVHGMMIAGLFLVAITPLVLGLTYYLFDFSLGRKIGLTLAMAGHMLILIPLQFFLQAWFMYHYSLLFMPLLFFIGGLPLDVMVFIALFSWGFSWRDMLHREEVQRKVRA
jgi:hypothetical protein